MARTNEYVLTFRTHYIVARFKSVYDVQAVVMTYVRPGDAEPTMATRYKTLAVAKREAANRADLNQWQGQSFIVEVKPGTTEITSEDVPTTVVKAAA